MRTGNPRRPGLLSTAHPWNPPPLEPLPSVCIVGAGLAGLAAARALAEAGVAAVVVDKSRGVGGRAATRWRDVPDSTGDAGSAAVRWRVDHGAQVFTPEPGSPADRVARSVLAPGALVEITRPTVPFSDDGTLRPEHVRTDGAPRLALHDGYAALGRALASRLDVRLGTTATRLAHTGAGWTVDAETPDGPARLGPFRAVLLTPPAPQAALLVAASDFDAAARDALAAGLSAATYRPQWTVVLAFAHHVALPGDAYALVNVPDGEHALPGERRPHAVAWLADETCKPGRAPAGAGLLVAQMSAGWTRAHVDDDRETLVAAAVEHVEALVGPLPARLWTDAQRWRYSLPDAAVDPAALAPAEALGAFAAGDAVAGLGRAHLALESGLDVAARIAAFVAARAA